MLSANDVAFKIISVQSIPWKKRTVKTAGCPHASLVLRLAGSSKIQIREKTLVSNPGEITYIPANTSYSATYPEDGKLLTVHFSETVPFFHDAQNFTPHHFDDIHALFTKILAIWNAKQQNYRMEAACMFLQIMVYLFKLKSVPPVHDTYEKAVHILQTEFTNATLSISEVCRRANISDSYLRKRFHEEFGLSPIRYLNELRLEYAQKLLLSNFCTLENAALQSGFSDYRYFARVVKKMRGCTPSKLRHI